MNAKSTVSVEPAEDSSSASAKLYLLRMVIRGIKQTLPGVYEITPDAGSAFFLRAAYLSIVSTDVLEESVEFSDEQWADILNAALVFSAERLAMRYLSSA